MASGVQCAGMVSGVEGVERPSVDNSDFQSRVLIKLTEAPLEGT